MPDEHESAVAAWLDDILRTFKSRLGRMSPLRRAAFIEQAKKTPEVSGKEPT